MPLPYFSTAKRSSRPSDGELQQRPPSFNPQCDSGPSICPGGRRGFPEQGERRPCPTATLPAGPRRLHQPGRCPDSPGSFQAAAALGKRMQRGRRLSAQRWERRRGAAGYSQFASGAGNTRARHVSSAPQLAPRTLMAGPWRVAAGSACRARGCAGRGRGGGRTAGWRRRARPRSPRRGRGGPPAPSPQRRGEAIGGRFQEAFRSWGQGSGTASEAW